MYKHTCSLAGAAIPICVRKDKNIWSSIAVSFSSVKGTIGTDTCDAKNETQNKYQNVKCREIIRQKNTGNKGTNEKSIC